MPKAKVTKRMQETEFDELLKNILDEHVEPEEMPEAIGRAKTLCEELGLFGDDETETAQAAS